MTCTRKFRSQAYAAAGEGGASSPFWPSGGVERAPTCFGWWQLGPVGFVAMILGFVLFWPIGLGLLFLNIWLRKGGVMPFAHLMDRASFGRTTTSGNMAFDDWRKAEIERIEKERQRLHEAEREFNAFVEELRRAKDREEFERFMTARRAGTAADRPQG